MPPVVQVCVPVSHTGAPGSEQSPSLTHATHTWAVGSQTGVAPPQSVVESRQPTQVWVPATSQTGAEGSVQSVVESRQPTHTFLEVSQTGVAPPQSVVESRQPTQVWVPATSQTGAEGSVQSVVESRQPTHTFLEVSQTGVAPPQSVVESRQPTQTPFPVSHTGSAGSPVQSVDAAHSTQPSVAEHAGVAPLHAPWITAGGGGALGQAPRVSMRSSKSA